MLLDTHAWVWLIEDNPLLNAAARSAIESASASQSLYLSPISLWEVALKASRGKMQLGSPIRPWLRRAVASSGIVLVQITPDLAADCAELPPEFHGDPADRIIAATARSEGLTLITHDARLIALSKQGHFQVIAT